MKTLLVFPPGWNPHAPYLALPLLAAHLRAQGHAVRVFDANIDFLDHVLREEFLSGASDRLAAVQRAANGRASAGPWPEVLEILAPDLVRHIGPAVRGFRSMECFEQPELYEWCRRILAASLHLISCAYPGLRLDLHSISFTRHPVTRSSHVMEAVEDGQANVFRDYFDHRLRPLIEDGEVGLLGFSVTDRDQLIPALTFASLARQTAGRDLRIVFGGNYFSRIAAHWSRRHPFQEIVDFVVVGEGENAIVELAEALEGQRGLESVSNLCFADGDEIRFTDSRPVDLDRAPRADFSDLPLETYLSPALILPTFSTRSCSWNRCAFCTIPSTSGQFRLRPVERITEEIAALSRAHDTSYFTFIDEALPPGVVRRLSEALIAARLDMRWYGEARMVSSFNDKLLSLAHAAGARLIQFGLESYNQRVLDAIDKGIRVEHIEPLLLRCLRHGIAFHLFSMVGFPTESAHEAQRTLAFTDRVMRRAREEFANPCCTRGISTFGLERGSRVALEPGTFGVHIEEPAAGCDLQLDLAYTVEEGLGPDEARQLVAASSGIDVYRDILARRRQIGWNRLLAPGAPREEETFLHWCRSQDGPCPGDRRDHAAARWPEGWSPDSDDGRPERTAPWVRLVLRREGALAAANGDGTPSAPAPFAVDQRSCAVYPLEPGQRELLERLANGGQPPTGEDERHELRRLAVLGLLTGSGTAAAELDPQTLSASVVRPFAGIELVCLPEERYILFDPVLEKAISLNHTGAMIWVMMGAAAGGRDLLERVQGLYGEAFTAHHLAAFLAHLGRDGVLHAA